MQTLLTIK